MKGIDVLVVRLLPFILYVIIGVNTLCCFLGVDITITYELHGNSALYALGLFFISLANKKYHCVWNRAMYILLTLVPTINFFDSCFCIFPTITSYMATMLTLYVLTALITAYLAIKHFVDIRIKKLTNGN